MSHVEISRDMHHMKEQEEERRRGTQLSNDGHRHVDQELVDVQTVWLTMQEALDDHFGVHGVPSNIQGAMDAGERQLTVARQSLRIIESHGPHLVTKFRGDPLLTSEEQSRLRSLVKDDKDRQAVRKGGSSGRGGGSLGARGGKVGASGRGAKKSGGKKFVSGSSQSVVSSVSPGLVSNARRGAIKPSAKNQSVFLLPPPANSAIICAPLAPKAREQIPFNNIVKVSDVELLEKLEGGW